MKKFGKALLFPHISILIILVPLSVFLLVYSMVFIGTNSIMAYISYPISAYTLTVICVRIPRIINFWKKFKAENSLVLKWSNNPSLRISASLYLSLILNTAYAIFMLGLGFYHSSFWYYSLAGYYIMLAAMRAGIVRFTKDNIGDDRYAELRRFRACGIIFLILNLSISLLTFFMIYWGRTFIHHEITAISMAAFTFTSLTLSIIGIVKYRRYDRPAYSAAKAISLASSAVSMLTLESTMLTAFGDSEKDAVLNKTLLAVSGAVIFTFILIMALIIIIKSTRGINKLRKENT